MRNSKLEQLGMKLPILPVTSVGSMPKPPYLTEARAQLAKGQIAPAQVRELEEKATTEWIRFQEEIGVDVLVDGEMYRGDMVAYFAETLAGFEKGGLVRSYGNRYYHKPIIAGTIEWKGPMTVNWWRYSQQLTDRPVKGMLTGPYTMMDWLFIESYNGSRAEACLALAGEIRKEVKALIDAGCKIIQIDEPAVSVRPEELPLALKAMAVVTDGLPAYFLTHICYGDFTKIYPELQTMAVDNFDLELSNSDNSLLPMFRKHPFTKDLSAGVVDVHSHALESVDVVKQRIRMLTGYVPADRLWLDPDCGLKTRTVEEARGKLKVICDAVREIRSDF